jgi:hypothetical protein
MPGMHYIAPPTIMAIGAAIINKIDAALFAVIAPNWTGGWTNKVAGSANGNINWTADKDGFVDVFYGRGTLNTTANIDMFITSSSAGPFDDSTRVWLGAMTVGTQPYGMSSPAFPVKRGDYIRATASNINNASDGGFQIRWRPPAKIPAPWATEIAWTKDYSTLTQRTNVTPNWAGSITTQWTSTFDGWVRLAMFFQNTNDWEGRIYINIDGVRKFERMLIPTSGVEWQTEFFSIRKGQVVYAQIVSMGGNAPTGTQWFRIYSVEPIAVFPPEINETFSTSEVNTGKIYNGKPVYRKMVNYTSAALSASGSTYQTIPATTWLGVNVDTMVKENIYSARQATWSNSRVGSQKIAAGTILNPMQKFDSIDQQGTYNWASTDYTAAQPITLSGWCEYTKV